MRDLTDRTFISHSANKAKINILYYMFYNQKIRDNLILTQSLKNERNKDVTTNQTNQKNVEYSRKADKKR